MTENYVNRMDRYIRSICRGAAANGGTLNQPASHPLPLVQKMVAGGFLAKLRIEPRDVDRRTYSAQVYALTPAGRRLAEGGPR